VSKQLPLDDPRWVLLEVPHGLLTQRTGGDRALAAHDLTALLATQVHSMRRYFGRYRDPRRPKLERELLPFSFWDEHKLSWHDGLRIRHAQSSQTMPAVGLYAWEPDLQKFCPAAKTDDSMQPPPRRRGPPVTDDWFTICGEIARRCIDPKSGRVRIPKNQTELVEDILQWCQDEHDREPAKSSLHEAVRRVCAALAKAQK
jgi:hypothetical protein